MAVSLTLAGHLHVVSLCGYTIILTRKILALNLSSLWEQITFQPSLPTMTHP